jgi:hypothetical protein
LTINPKIDSDWVPDGLVRAVGGLLGLIIVVLVALLIFAGLAWGASKVSTSFYARNSQAGLRIGTLIAAAAIIGALGSWAVWSVNNMDPLPGGIHVDASSSKVTYDRHFAAKYGRDAARSMGRAGEDAGRARKQWDKAKKQASEGKLGQAAGSAAGAAGSALHSGLEAIKGGLQAIQHHGLLNTIKDGSKAIVDKGKQVGGWIGSKLGF